MSLCKTSVPLCVVLDLGHHVLGPVAIFVVPLGRAADADALALHLLARSQGVASLANAFHDEDFIEREVDDMCDWLTSCAA